MQAKFTTFLVKYERLIPVVLFMLFVLITVPGISWGAGSLWNPDELVWRVIKALDGEMRFDETEPDFVYPSLPKHVMFGVGWLVRFFRGSSADVVVPARLISVVLGGLTIVLVYQLAKLFSKSVYVHLLTAFLVLSNLTLAHNARFAHNDLYLLFFITLTVFSLTKFGISKYRLWLYLAFFSVGLAASSKYTGAGFFAVPFIVYFALQWTEFRKDMVRGLETLFLGSILSYLGYALGTPKALLWMAYYLKRMVPAALQISQYERGPDSLIGLFGQWGVFREAVSAPIYYLFLAAIAWFLVKLILVRFGKLVDDPKRMNAILILLISIFVFDVPIMASYNYLSRFFLPIIPMFAILASLFLEDVVEFANQSGYRVVTPILGVAAISVFTYLFLNIISVVLLFKNDARIAAAEYIRTLPRDSFVEYTLYPPSIPDGYFASQRNYPIFFIKYLGGTVPTNKPYQYNVGEDGLYERGADYLIIDTFTYARFSDPFICETNPVECEFFTKLMAGETSLHHLAAFEYSLPPYLPQISLVTVNPRVDVYEIQK